MPLLSTIGAVSKLGFSPLGGGLFPFTTFQFTNAAGEGTTGPTLGQMQSAYSGAPWLTNFFSASLGQGHQQLTIPKTGLYTIRAAGAQGGSGAWATYYGGKGAIIEATFPLIMGDILIMVIGQRGGSSSANNSSGGGGGSFIAKNNKDTLLLVAGGGGGGGGNSAPGIGYNALTIMSGGANQSGNPGGTGGSGSTVSYNGGGGGGGYLSDGAVGVVSALNEGGKSFKNGLALGGRGGSCAASIAGSYNYNNLGNDQGGFGGGGGGEWCAMGAVGAGGGYSGGAGNNASSGQGGGGGSFILNTANNLKTSDGNYNGVATGNTSLGYNGTTTLAERAQSNGYIIVTAL